VIWDPAAGSCVTSRLPQAWIVKLLTTYKWKLNAHVRPPDLVEELDCFSLPTEYLLPSNRPYRT
jgi:hypothetical protein